MVINYRIDNYQHEPFIDSRVNFRGTSAGVDPEASIERKKFYRVDTSDAEVRVSGSSVAAIYVCLWIAPRLREVSIQTNNHTVYSE